MQPDLLKLLYDVEQACSLAVQFIHGKAYADFENDPLLRSAVERQFITIGEAIQQAVRLEPSLTDTISHTRRIVNFRNVIVHGYAHVQTKTVWGIVESDLPTLHAEVRALLAPYTDITPD